LTDPTSDDNSLFVGFGGLNINHMKTCIIIDDEQNARETLQKMLQRYFSSRISISGIADSIKEGVLLINQHKPDLVFLDIEMPQENGLELFKYFDRPDFELVFTTAYEQYAIKAIKYAALDYILKPINQIELGEAITKIELKDRINKNTSLHIEALMHNLNSDSDQFTKVAFPSANGYTLEKLKNIVYCQADKNYCIIHTITGKKIIVTKPLKFIAEMLPVDSFFRIHKTYLINLNYIENINKSAGGQVVMSGDIIIPIASTHYTELIERINK